MSTKQNKKEHSNTYNTNNKTTYKQLGFDVILLSLVLIEVSF